MTERLRRALEYEAGELVDHPGGDTQAIIHAAARRFLALTETGQRVEWCETHRVELKMTYVEGYDGPRECQDSPYFDGDCRIVPKLLADYLT